MTENKLKEYYISKMTPEMIKIYECTKWNETNFIPSFKNTDIILMNAAKKTYRK